MLKISAEPLTFRSIATFSAIGAVWLLYLLDYNISIAVWVGMIALMGLDAETGVFMLLFLDLSYDDAKAKGQLRNRQELVEAIIANAAARRAAFHAASRVSFALSTTACSVSKRELKPSA